LRDFLFLFPANILGKLPLQFRRLKQMEKKCESEYDESESRKATSSWERKEGVLYC
jgi:hypothetical protein